MSKARVGINHDTDIGHLLPCLLSFATPCLKVKLYRGIYGLDFFLIFCSYHLLEFYCRPALIDSACQLELAGMLMLGNVNGLQHFEVCLHL